MNRRVLLIAAGAFAVASAAGVRASERPPADAVAYESIDQLRAIAAKGPAILYFHAEWCPTCQATMTTLRARWPEVQPGIVLVLADYDAEGELKTRYGVTYQNTFVQVGADGERLQIWNGGGLRSLNERPIFPAQ